MQGDLLKYMKVMSSLNSLVLVFIIVFTLGSASIYAQGNWLAYGELRGNLQPCGCDPQTDLGGVRRIGTLLSREKAAIKAPILVFDLGGNFHQPVVHDLASRYLSKSLDALSPDAALLTLLDLPYLEANKSTRAFVLSNRAPGAAALKGISFQEVIVSKQAIIFGYYWRSGQAGLVAWGKALERRWQDLRKGQEKLPVFLLFHGPSSQLEAMVTSGVFATIISSNHKPAEKTFDLGEQADSKNLLALPGKADCYMVPLGGAGVLRGGGLRAQVAPSLEQMVAKEGSQPIVTSKHTEPKPTPAFLHEQVVTWLAKGYDEGSPLKQLLTDYEQAAAAEFKGLETTRVAQLKESKFVGAEVCRSCHSKAYDIWKKTKHAIAYHTLEQAGKSENASCVACHVLGLAEPGGFVSVRASPQFAHVQCENCHGSRKEHVANPSVHKAAKGSAFMACAGCHNAVHSPKFQRDKFWQEIAH